MTFLSFLVKFSGRSEDGDLDIDQAPEMAIFQTGSTYISKRMIDIVKIPMAHQGL